MANESSTIVLKCYNPDIIATDIAENLEDALEQFRSIQEDLAQPA